jgi:hypothetical protein
MTRPPDHIVRAKLHEIDVRYQNGRKVNKATLRVAEIERLLTYRYGPILPDDDSGRDDTLIMAHHLAQISGDASQRISAWIARRAPWMQSEELERLTARVTGKPIRWLADTMGKRLNLTAADRRRLRIRTIGAVDKTKAERELELQARKADNKRSKRRKSGAKPRHEYEADAIGRGKPWIAEGISMATWYRRQKQVPPQPH